MGVSFMEQTQGETSKRAAGAPASRAGLCGIFELDSANTVLYSRFETADGSPPPEVNGRTLFEGAKQFANADELRRLINRFRTNEAKSDSFDFTCQWAGGPVAVKVLLARVLESYGRGATKSILVHIRERHHTAPPARDGAAGNEEGRGRA